MKIQKGIFTFFFIVTGFISYSQDSNREKQGQCNTMQQLQIQLAAVPGSKEKFESERNRFNNLVSTGANRANQPSTQNGNRAIIIIPVVFHLILTNHSLVTDIQIQAQLDTLNSDFAGLNGDSVKIPVYFKPFFGKSIIRFCLARQTPSGQPTTGIERITTPVVRGESVKYTVAGGADSWDPSSYLNIWISEFGTGDGKGFATFPGTGKDNEQGIVVNYRTLPGGSFPAHSDGKTLTHEMGHYFNLYHIWGDDGSGCNGADYVDDTPNQTGPTLECYNGIKTDNCSSTGNGIMFQNYMDYSPDNCQVMFTTLQTARMESALLMYRASLLTSIACQTPSFYSIDAQLRAIIQPGQRICTNSFTPSINILNRGLQTLNVLTVTTVLDNSISSSYQWTGTLLQQASIDIAVNAVQVPEGQHILKIYLSDPNNTTDQNTLNDTLSVRFSNNSPVSTVIESFEGMQFPPAGWDIINPGSGITWQKANGIGKTGNSSVMINDIRYPLSQQDYLRLPSTIIPAEADTAFLSFQVASATYTPITLGYPTDTLEVLISKNCGNSYSSLYKKWGSSLITHSALLSTSFMPATSDWRKDSINLSGYIGAGNVLIAFRNTTGLESNIYLDDINLRTVTINSLLKARELLVTPSPTTGLVAVQFYPQPTDVKAIAVFSMSGQKIAETIPNGQSNYYTLNITHAAAGAYMVRVVMGNNVMVKKIIKY